GHAAASHERPGLPAGPRLFLDSRQRVAGGEAAAREASLRVRGADQLVLFPARYICPDGAGRPPAGSRVTANTSTVPTPGNVGTRSVAAPLGSAPKEPGGTGAYFPDFSQLCF